MLVSGMNAKDFMGFFAPCYAGKPEDKKKQPRVLKCCFAPAYCATVSESGILRTHKGKEIGNKFHKDLPVIC